MRRDLTPHLKGKFETKHDWADFWAGFWAQFWADFWATYWGTDKGDLSDAQIWAQKKASRSVSLIGWYVEHSRPSQVTGVKVLANCKFRDTNS